MLFSRDLDLIPCTPGELALAQAVHWQRLQRQNLILYDASVSDFFFEFAPEDDIGLFLEHAYFAGVINGTFVTSRENLAQVAEEETTEPRTLSIRLGTTLPEPFRHTPSPAAFERIASGAEFRGQITNCSCGIAGCNSQYAWTRDSVCLALFTISGATLIEVAWFPFRIELR